MPNKIGRFDIVGEITRSPLGCVLKAQDPDGGQTVALKTFDIHSLGDATAEALRCALAEAAGETARHVVLATALPDPELACGADASFTRIEPQHDLAQGDEVVAALLSRAQFG